MAEKALVNFPPLSRVTNTIDLPSQYQTLKVMGEGAFGTVLQCYKKDTKDIVAVKIPRPNNDLGYEVRSF